MASWNHQANEIFLAVLEIADPGERRAYLEKACAGDGALLAQVESMLEASERAANFLQTAAEPRTSSLDVQLTEKPGTTIGPYKLLEQIGEGGFGVVFMAEQHQPIRRKVALKVIKAGMDTRQVIARFEAERQALALMDHPNIAKVLDAGATASGRPYFVMELVRGLPITAYCDEAHLNPRERLELFLHVCEAVQHAHQKGIIHRDIKPSNVLITLHDGKPTVKVIDFGIAKATGQQLTDKTLFTNFAQMVGTPLYMSPEQAGGSADIDTRSDIYGLGVLLYELLTGSTPFDKERLKSAAFDEIRRIIREEDPPRPSTRLSGSVTLASVAAMCKMEPKRLSHLFRGEVDWIVMKALEKDRNRRYETANGFAMDIKRYLNDEPVLACPPSAISRVRKFVRRNKGAVAAVACVLVTLVCGVVGTTVALFHAERSREEAQARAEETAAALEFVETKVFSAAKPLGFEGGLGSDVTLLQALDSALPHIASSFTEHPLIEARLRLTLARSYTFMHEFAPSAEQAEAAFKLYSKFRGPKHPDTIKAMGQTAFCYENTNRAAEALRLREEGFRLRTEVFGPFAEETLAAMSALGRSYRATGRDEEGFQLMEKSLALCKEKLGESHDQTLSVMLDLGTALNAVGKSSEGIAIYEKVLERRKGTPGHLQTLTVMNNLAVMYGRLGRHDESIVLLEELLRTKRAILGSNHLNTLDGIRNLAVGYHKAGRHTEAQPLWEEALALAKTQRNPDPRMIYKTTAELAGNYQHFARHSDIFKLLSEALPHAKAKLGADDFVTLDVMLKLSDAEAALGRPDQAFALRTEAYALCKARYGPTSGDTLYCARHLADSHSIRGFDHVRAGRMAEAIAEFDTVLDLSQCDYTLANSAAVVFLHFNDLKRYRRACQVLLDRAAKLDPQSHGPAGLIAQACALGSEPAADLSRIEELAERGVSGNEKGPLYRELVMAKALCEHRAGRPEKAIEWLRNVPQAEQDATAFALLALAQHRRGAIQEARKALIAARSAKSANLNNWMQGQILCREAEVVMGSVSPQEQADGERVHWDRELAALTKAMEEHPGSRRALLARAHWLGTHGRFDVAERDFERLIEMSATDHWLWYRRACLLAYLGKREAFEAHGRAMIKRYANATDSAILDRTTKPLLLVPDLAGADLQELTKRVDLSLKFAADSSWAALLKGMLELRAGRSEPAAAWLAKSRSAPAEGFPARVVAAGAYLAIAQHQLGQIDNAKATLAAATEEAKALPVLGRDDLGKGSIENWLIAQMALREAEATILGRQLLPAPVAAGAPVPPLPPRLTSPAPFRNKPVAVPGRIEAEDFDNGGQGIAYHDTTDENLGKSRTPEYRLESVDIEDCADKGGGFNIGDVLAGEWLAYTIEIEEAGTYQLDLRLCSPHGGRMHVEFAGKDITGAIQIPKTGWGKWVTVTAKGLRLDKGRQVMRMIFDASGNDVYVGNLNWIEIRRPVE